MQEGSRISTQRPSAASRNQKRRFDRMNRIYRIKYTFRVKLPLKINPVHPVHPVKTLPKMRSFRILHCEGAKTQRKIAKKAP
jgi:hypothetical protein